ncbi:BAG family molecular chaperone regulator 4 [Gastrophryne carolinensis]
MSAAHRAGNGGGYYPGGEVLARQRQEEAAAAGWGAGYYPQETEQSWPGGGDMGGASGAQNPQYPGYNPNVWSCAGHPRPPYPPNYTVGGQGMEQYANGSYGPTYGQSGMNPPYPGLQPPNPYLSPPSQPHYPVDPYKQPGGAPPPPPHWGYPQQHPPFPQYSAPPAMPQQSPQNENWNMYGAPNPYQWHNPPPPPQNPSSGHYITGGRAPWPAADVQPNVYDMKDASQPPDYNHQRPFPGYQPNMPQPGPPAEPKPNPIPPNPHYSASPQMYNRKDPSNPETVPKVKEANASPADPGATNPGIVKINQILEKVAELEEEVDEFVGKKTEMCYRRLEELLTKQLLELDSVETGGHDNVRQARKEAVRKLQSILERLERKGL